MSYYPGGQPPYDPYRGQPPADPYAPPQPPADPYFGPPDPYAPQADPGHAQQQAWYGQPGWYSHPAGGAPPATAARGGRGGAGAAIVGLLLVLLGIWILFGDQTDLDLGEVWPMAVVAIGVVMVIAAFIPRGEG